MQQLVRRHENEASLSVKGIRELRANVLLVYQIMTNIVPVGGLCWTMKAHTLYIETREEKNGCL